MRLDQGENVQEDISRRRTFRMFISHRKTRRCKEEKMVHMYRRCNWFKMLRRYGTDVLRWCRRLRKFIRYRMC